MHNAQCLAGMAFSNALLGIVHSMAHKTGAVFGDYGAHIIHGAANAMYLPKVIAFNAKDKEAAKRYAKIADVLGLSGNTDEDKIKELIKKQFGLNDVIVKITSKAKISPKEKVKIISEKPKSTILSENYNFENFIIGDSNKFAFECSVSVAKEPGIRFNPLFIYGPSGLGKTHLLQSIGNYCIKKGKTVICVTSEQFANDFVFNLKNNSIDKFKQKYRNCDVLLIDDIQFLIGRDKAQEELFYTFNELKDKNCQIVLTNDLPPKFLKGFESRLTTRFESGIIANITPPNLETKIAIINKKSEENRVRIPHDVVEYIAANMGDNIREIEGAINKLNAYSSILRTKITLEFTKSTLQDQIHQKYSSERKT